VSSGLLPSPAAVQQDWQCYCWNSSCFVPSAAMTAVDMLTVLLLLLLLLLL
jgi:hypothetical protein